MAIDGLLLHYLTNELKEQIVGARINKIIQSDPYIINFTIHNFKQMNLLINISRSNPKIYLTNNIIKTPTNPYNFCMVLRKYLERGIINNIEQIRNDRILIITISSINELGDLIIYKLIIELTGKTSNVILCTEDFIIIDAITKQFSLDSPRLIIPKAKYEMINSDKINPFNAINDSTHNNYEGLSKFHQNKLSEYESINSFLNQEIVPTKYIIDNKTFFSPFYFKEYKEFKQYNSFSEMLDDDVLELTENNPEYNNLKKIIKRKITLLNNKINNLNEDLEKAKKHEIDEFKGNLIKTYLYDIKKGMNEVTLLDYETNLEYHISLDPLLNPVQNMQKYYKNYKKSITTKEKVNEQLIKTKDEINYFEDLLLSLDLVFETNSLLKNENNDLLIQDIKDELIKHHLLQQKNKKSTKKTSSIKQYDIGDALIFVGKNTIQNNYLISKVGKPNDYWFHVSDAPSAHIIVRCNNLNERIIRIAAQLASLNSKYEISSSVKVDYTLFKNVKKIPNTLGCHVTYTNQKSIYIDPDIKILEELLKAHLN